MKTWFEGEGCKVLDRAGLSWDANRLGIPEIPVASLEPIAFTTIEINRLQDRIAESQYVAEIKLLP